MQENQRENSYLLHFSIIQLSICSPDLSCDTSTGQFPEGKLTGASQLLRLGFSMPMDTAQSSVIYPRRDKHRTKASHRQSQVYRRPGQELLPFPGHRPISGETGTDFVNSYKSMLKLSKESRCIQGCAACLRYAAGSPAGPVPCFSSCTSPHTGG